jgi:hypothetical protein
MTALESAQLDQGPPLEALDRMLAAAWQHLARYQAMAQAVSELLSPEAVTRTHQAARQALAALLERGRADGSFRRRARGLARDGLRAGPRLLRTASGG